MIYLKKGIFVIKIVVLPFYSQFTHKLSTTIGYESYFMSAKITYGCFFLFMFIVEIDQNVESNLY